MVAEVDVRREVDDRGGPVLRRDDTGPATSRRTSTLYLPDETVWVERGRLDGRKWVEVDRDDHNLGVVPVVMHLNRRMSGGWTASRR
jgi:hypothetical protein